MFRFFRQLRHKLLAGSHFRRYLLYAVGEIVLVVIGILIALQVNSWQEAKERREREIEALSQLKEALDPEISDLQMNVDAIEGALRSIKIVRNHLESHLPFTDSLAYHFGNSSRAMGYIINSGVYEQIKSSGIDLISSDSLRNRILTHYDVNTSYLVDIENILVHNHNNTIVRPIMIRKFDYSWFTNPAFPNDYSALENDSEFLSVLKTTAEINRFQLSRTRAVLKSAKELQEAIEEELIQLRE